MLILIRFTPKEKEAKTLLAEFKLDEITTRYREPIDEDVVRLLAAKVAFDNDAVSIHTWFGNLMNKQDEALQKDLKLIRRIG